MAVWRDISLMWLSCLTVIAVLPAGAILLLAVKGMHSLRRKIKKAVPVAQARAAQASSVAERVSRTVSGPAISIRAKVAQISAIRRASLRR